MRVAAEIRVLQLRTEGGPGLSGNCQTLEEAQRTLSWSLKGPHGPGHTWTFAFWPPELGVNQSCHSKPCNLWSFAKASPRKPHTGPEAEDTEWLQCMVVVFSHSCPTLHDPWTAAPQASLSFTISQSLLKLMSIESVMPANHLVLCCPLLLLPLIFPSTQVFANESAVCIRQPKYWSFSCSISPSNEYSELISFRIDWFDLLAVQRTLKSLLQHHSSKASVLQCSAFFMVQLSHLYMTTGKTAALTRRNFVSKVMSLLLNTLSRHGVHPPKCCLGASPDREPPSRCVSKQVPPQRVPCVCIYYENSR